MKMNLLSIIFLTVLVSAAYGQDHDKLYPIPKGNLWGYCNEKGKTIIQAKFLSAGKFSEGLAAVRLNGTYGYVDKSGEFTISPEFDLAGPFKNGIAKVFINGKPFFIDRKGNILFQHNYQGISGFNGSSLATVVTATKKCGVIDKSGKLIIDTAFALIGSFTNGIAIVTGLNHRPYAYDTTKEIVYEKGIIDTLGNWVVKYGKYKDISDFRNGYALVELLKERQQGFYDYRGVIDEKGIYRFTIPAKKWRLGYSDDNFYNGIAIVSIYSVNPDTVRVWSSKNRYEYKGAINTDGKVIFSNSDWDELTPFFFDRAFAKDKSGKWFLVNTSGKIVGSQAFDKILYDTYGGNPEFLFQDGKEFVKTAKGWGAIDTKGKFVVEPHDLSKVDFNHLIRRGDIIFLEEDISVESDRYSYRYGFWDTKNNIIVKPEYHDIDMNGFGSGLIYVMKDEQMAYINSKGKKIWEARAEESTSQLNIDFMNRGYYYASSKFKRELAGAGGWGSSENSSKKIDADITFIAGKLQILIDENQKTKWEEKYDAVKLFVANTTGDTLYFDAQDSRLYLKLQAQDKNGDWKDIEYLPASWCGNSYHSLFLAPDELWEFATPVYQGEFKTKIRAQLLYRKSKEQKENDVIYSNVIDGFVNPGQFWNKREYVSSGLMDPYND